MMSRLRMPDWRDESGLGMVIVITVIVLVTGMVTTASVVAVNGLRQSSERTRFEASLSVAENGIEQVLAELQTAYDDYNADYPVPAPSGSLCTAPKVTSPADFATEAAERTWAKQQLQALLTAHPECVQSGPRGDYLVLKPATPVNAAGYYPGYGRVYSIGWSPSRADPNRTARLVKTEYVFMPYRPSSAILTSGDLDISSSTTVTVAAGYTPTDAGVHSNGVITTVGNPTVYGEVSSAGASSASSNNFFGNTGGAVAQTSTVQIPDVSALSLYRHAVTAAGSSLATWYDLCPDGKARAYSMTGVPCSSSTEVPLSNIGWSFSLKNRPTVGQYNVPTWTASRNLASGTYFAYGANMEAGVGNIDVNNLTLIAASESPDTCSTKRYGTIIWDHYNMDAPAFPNLFIYADGDLVTGANFHAGDVGGAGVAPISGMFVAGDQAQFETSSTGAVGSLLTAGRCDTDATVVSNQVKNPTVYFDPSTEAPFTSVISTTLWLEYVG